jgi:hypothetical protein
METRKFFSSYYLERRFGATKIDCKEKQSNAVDCGVNMLRGMLYACDDMETTFVDMNCERLRWASDILEGKIQGLIDVDTAIDVNCDVVLIDLSEDKLIDLIDLSED